MTKFVIMITKIVIMIVVHDATDVRVCKAFINEKIFLGLFSNSLFISFHFIFSFINFFENEILNFLFLYALSCLKYFRVLNVGKLNPDKLYILYGDNLFAILSFNINYKNAILLSFDVNYKKLINAYYFIP